MVGVYSSTLAPFWVVEAELVRLLLALGSVKSALDRALKVQLWDEVIACYNRLNLKHKAAEVILQQVAILSISNLAKTNLANLYPRIVVKFPS
jgi:hypothetical protein